MGSNAVRDDTEETMSHFVINGTPMSRESRYPEEEFGGHGLRKQSLSGDGTIASRNYGIGRAFSAYSDDDAEADGANQSLTRSELETVGSEAESSLSSEPESPRSLQTGLNVPQKHSSRLTSAVDGHEYGSQNDNRGAARGISEATRRNMAKGDGRNHRYSGRPRKAIVETQRSATPPPIDRIWQPTEDTFHDSDPDPDSRTKHRPPVLDVAALLQDLPQPTTISRRHSQTSNATQQSRIRRELDNTDARTPVLEPIQLSAELKSPPGVSSRSNRPYSYKVPRQYNGPDNAQLQDRLDHRSLKQGIPLQAHSDAGSSRIERRPQTASQRAINNDAPLAKHTPAEGRSIASHGSSGRLPDFFSYEIFKAVMQNPTTSYQLLQFCEKRLCGENIEFLNKVDEYQKVLADLSDVLGTVHKNFISEKSPSQINLPGEVMRSVQDDLKSIMTRTCPKMETLFADAQARIEEYVFTDVYQSKADNPIVFASEGFVKVTGYTRAEIIPRNCRFLQGSQTDRAAIRRVKKGITECSETIELILNYKKNGDPFWNLLYISPLYDANGKVAFFLGGQVNCSTTVHNNVDVMRILSISNSTDPEEEVQPKSKHSQYRPGPMPSARRAILKALRVRVDEAKEVTSNTGMEYEVLSRMEGQNLDSQMKEFYAAYSKYFVVKADTFVIGFYSEGVTELLGQTNSAGPIVGQDVFRFFKQYMLSKETDFRGRVRSAIRSGDPISVELRLQTRRSARFRGDETFVTHWTPLKDESAAPQWVVVTLAPTLG